MSDQCPHCTRTFAGANALFQHVKVKHGRKAARALRPPVEREQSMGDILIEAQIARASGEPVEEWIAVMFNV